MNEPRLELPAGSDVDRLARAFDAVGGCLVVVGGYVRDGLAGRASHDLDLEIFGLDEAAVEAVVVGFGFSPRVGRQFPIWRRSRDGLDLAYPRAGARDYHPGDPGSLERAFRAASRHRDLTVNALGWAPLANAIVDPWGGREDLRRRRLRAVDRETFGADPVRLLRVARLQAVLEAEVDDALVAVCRALDLADVPVERIAAELRRMLLDVPCPARCFAWLAGIGRLDAFAPLAALVGVPQDPVWHPEGDVFVHTLLVLDRARALAASLPGPEAEFLMLAALCHDLGKPQSTTRADGRIRSIGHERESGRATRAWLRALRFPERVVEAVAVLVDHHLAPVQLVSSGAGPRAYRRLARKLALAGRSFVELERVARADQLGRTTSDALAGRFEAGERFLAAAEAAGVREAPRPDLVRAADLMARGIAPGPELGRWLRRCRELEDATGARDPEPILARCLAERAREGG